MAGKYISYSAHHDESPRKQHTSIPKALGRRVSGYNYALWCDRRVQIVAHGCYANFSQNPELASVLLSTGSTTLVEARPYDRIWGVGLAESDPEPLPPGNGVAATCWVLH